MTTESTERAIVTINEACELAKVCRRTVYNWLNEGKLEYLRTAGGQVRIYADSLFLAVDTKGIRTCLRRQDMVPTARFA